MQECQANLERLRAEQDDDRAGLAEDEREMESLMGKSAAPQTKGEGLLAAQDPRARLPGLRRLRDVPRQDTQGATHPADPDLREDRRAGLGQ
jgi:hypothetical protein